MSENEKNSNKEDNNNSKENKISEEIDLDSKKDEEDKNEDSKSIILAPYNSFDSENNNNDSEEEEQELDVLNEACKFDSLAQQGNIKYVKNFENYNN